MTVLASGWSRLVVRAVLAGALVFVTTLQAADDPLGRSTLVGAATAAFWAAVEILTPVNRTVGVGSPES